MDDDVRGTVAGGDVVEVEVGHSAPVTAFRPTTRRGSTPQATTSSSTPRVANARVTFGASYSPAPISAKRGARSSTCTA